MLTKTQFEKRKTDATSAIQTTALEFGSIFVLIALKRGILEDIESEKEGAKEYGEKEDTSTLALLQEYAVELDTVIARLNAIEEKYNPKGKESAAQIDARDAALDAAYNAMMPSPGNALD
jgi:chromosome segregation ATPase